MLSILRRQLLRRATLHTAELAERFDRCTGADAAALQLRLLNQTWCEAADSIPFYQQLAQDIDRPNGFSSLKDYADSLPPAVRSDFQSNQDRSSTRYDSVRTTGGSTGQPVQFPTWKAEYEHAREVVRVGRHWNDLNAWDSCTLIWGHSHLLGHGLRGVLRGAERQIKDTLLGYSRVSAYDLSPTKLASLCSAIAGSRSTYLIGYSCALDRVARHFLETDARNLKCKVVIATAEALPFDDSQKVIERAFNAPLAMEYGAVETGAIAYTRPHEGYHVFWWKYLLEAVPASEAKSDILVTALYPRATPLFRYRIGDFISGAIRYSEDQTSVLSFERVLGRSNALVRLPSGRQLHSEVATHIFRGVSQIRHYQLWCYNDRVEGRYVAARDLSIDETNEIVRLATKIDPEYGHCLQLKPTELSSLHQSVSGKYPFVVEKGE